MKLDLNTKRSLRCLLAEATLHIPVL